MVVKFIRRLKRGDLESSFEHIHIIDSIEEEHFKQEVDEENQEILANQSDSMSCEPSSRDETAVRNQDPEDFRHKQFAVPAEGIADMSGLKSQNKTRN